MGVQAIAGNKIYSNTGDYPLVNNHFMLRVEALYDLPCKAVKGFTKENEYETIQEGGVNDYVLLKRKPITKPFTFQVERYVGADYFDPMPNGAELILPVILLVTRYADEFGRTKRAYVFTGCTVIGKSFGDLDAEHSGLLVETTTIAYREMICFDTMWDNIKESIPNLGTIDESKLHANRNTTEIRKADMATKAMFGKEKAQRKYDATKGETKSAIVNTSEIRKADMAENAKYNDKKAQRKYDESNKDTRSAIINTSEIRKADMAENAKYNDKNAQRKYDVTKGKTKSAIVNTSEIRKKDMAENAKYNDKKAQRKFDVTKGETKSAITPAKVGYTTDSKKVKSWKFGKTSKEFKGEGIRSARINTSEIRKADMAKKAKFGKIKAQRKYDVAKGKIKSAQIYKTEIRKKDMAKKAMFGKIKAQRKYDITKGETKSAQINTSEIRKKDMADKAMYDDKKAQRKYDVTKGETKSAQVNTSEIRKKDMADKAMYKDTKAQRKYDGSDGIKSAIDIKEFYTGESKKPGKKWLMPKRGEPYIGSGNSALVNKEEIRKTDMPDKKWQMPKESEPYGGRNASAKTMPSKKPEQRIWPAKSSARKVEDFLNSRK